MALAALLLAGAVLRGAFPTADPPWQRPVGITWHDEGPWIHNARNRALWGTWSTDRWNPMYLAPVFTGVEYVSFALLGVGLWQARVAPMALGLFAAAMVATGLASGGNRRAALIAAALMACSHEWVQWNRVALLETPMVALVAISWSAYALAARRPWCGAVAGVAAVLAFFAKASAAFFLAALALEAIFTWLVPSGAAETRGGSSQPRADQGQRSAGENQRATEHRERRAALWTLGGLAGAGALFALFFVLPYWTEFRFYNWQMSVTRKPAYGFGALLTRASWVPTVNSFFTRMLPTTVLGLIGGLGLLGRWRTASPAERLLALWLAIGLAEVIVHDAGNERRLLIFFPALVVLTALLLSGRRPLLPASIPASPRGSAFAAAPLLAYSAYLVTGSAARPLFAGSVHATVWAGALGAIVLTAVVLFTWPSAPRWLAQHRVPPLAALGVVVAILACDLFFYGEWALARTYKNVTASRLVGDWLPPGTQVQGKLANGLALENRIRPVFIGHLFGNYEDRTERPDIRYILTYTKPRIGYEGAVIDDVLAANPGWKIVHEFDVAETPAGDDRAALIEKP
jgi:hypothetical protein